MFCYACGTENALESVSRSDTCIKCGEDIRVCKNCKFYDPAVYNECKEVSAERVVEKEKRNFCDYFVLSGQKGSGDSNQVDDAKRKLEELFSKK